MDTPLAEVHADIERRGALGGLSQADTQRLAVYACECHLENGDLCSEVCRGSG